MVKKVFEGFLEPDYDNILLLKNIGDTFPTTWIPSIISLFEDFMYENNGGKKVRITIEEIK